MKDSVPKSLREMRGTAKIFVDSYAQNQIYDKRTWLNTKELAVYLGTSVGSVRNMAWRGQLTSYRFLKVLLFKKTEVDRLIESGRVKSWYEKD